MAGPSWYEKQQECHILGATGRGLSCQSPAAVFAPQFARSRIRRWFLWLELVHEEVQHSHFTRLWSVYIIKVEVVEDDYRGPICADSTSPAGARKGYAFSSGSVYCIR